MPTKRFDTLDADRQAHLLDAAAAEFASHGYERSSFNRIIERTGTSKGSMYYYFEDKADLYGAVVRRAISNFVEACGPVLPAGDADQFWAQVDQLIRASMRHYRSHPHLAGLVRSLARDGLQVAPVADIRNLTGAWFAALVLSGQAAGAVRDDLPLDLVLSVAVSLSEGIDVWLADRVEDLTDAEIDALSDTMIDLYRRLAAPPEGT